MISVIIYKSHEECLIIKLATRELSRSACVQQLCVLCASAPLREIFAKNLSEKIHAEAKLAEDAEDLIWAFFPLCDLCTFVFFVWTFLVRRFKFEWNNLSLSPYYVAVLWCGRWAGNFFLIAYGVSFHKHFINNILPFVWVSLQQQHYFCFSK